MVILQFMALPSMMTNVMQNYSKALWEISIELQTSLVDFTEHGMKPTEVPSSGNTKQHQSEVGANGYSSTEMVPTHNSRFSIIK